MNLIKHVAIIMDGNGRWASNRGLPRIAGLHQGVKTVRKVTKLCGEIDIKNTSLTIEMNNRPKAIDMVTAIYPGFPTDLQAQWMALMTISKGSCTVTDTIYTDRFTHIAELERLGAQIHLDNNVAHINGVSNLFGAEVMSTDIRASASLVIAGLISKGTLWSATSLIDKKNHQLVIDVHLSFINAGADVLLTNSFTTRRIRMEQNGVGDLFNFANQKAGELAIKAKELSKKKVLIAASLPAQNDTYEVDKRDSKLIEKNFFDQANILNNYIDFFYLDVISSGREIEIALNIIDKLNKPVLVGLHIKKNGKLPSGETITQVVNKYKNSNWLGVVTACVSLEIIKKTTKELKKLNLPYGFKANLWSVEEPLPAHRFNNAGFNEIGKNPNITLGKREDIKGEVFCEFAKKIIENAATILGGCCETKPFHIREISKLKN